MNIYEQIILGLIIFVIIPLVSIIISPKVGNVINALSSDKNAYKKTEPIPTSKATPLKSYTINHRGQISKNN